MQSRDEIDVLGDDDYSARSPSFEYKSPYIEDEYMVKGEGSVRSVDAAIGPTPSRVVHAAPHRQMSQAAVAVSSPDVSTAEEPLSEARKPFRSPYVNPPRSPSWAAPPPQDPKSTENASAHSPPQTPRRDGSIVAVSQSPTESVAPSVEESVRSPDPASYLPEGLADILEDYREDEGNPEDEFHFEDDPDDQVRRPVARKARGVSGSPSSSRTSSPGINSPRSPMRSPWRSPIQSLNEVQDVSLDDEAAGKPDGGLEEEVFGENGTATGRPRSRATSIAFSTTPSMAYSSRMSTAEDPDAVFYPSPFPAKLRLPPLLSTRNKQRRSLTPDMARHGRPRSTVGMLNMPEPPNWGPSPLDDEFQFEPADGQSFVLPGSRDPGTAWDDSDADSLATNSGSDRATIVSEEDFRNLPSDIADTESPGPPRRSDKRKSWFSGAWTKLIHKQGEKLDEDDDVLQAASDSEMREEDLAFTRLDPDLVRQHAEMFHTGGVYSSTVPKSGVPTSLIEEIEIRKAGRRVQRELMIREAQEVERQRNEDPHLLRGGYAHPVDRQQHLSLMELQHLANADYQTRKSWHERAINKQNMQDTSATETLAQRRARIRKAKARGTTLGSESSKPQREETLAERRARLRKAKEAAAATLHPVPPSSSSAISVAPDEQPTEHLDCEAPTTPGLHEADESAAEGTLPPSPEFDMAHAVANMSPMSTVS